MEDKQRAATIVAAAFVQQYYLILNQSPENLHRFYQERSTLGWQRDDGDLKHFTTLTGISKKVMSSNYKDCSVEVMTTDCQESLDGGIIVVVTGCLTGKDNVKKNFSQTFVLAKQEKGFFVLNDIMRIFDVCESRSDVAVNSTDKDDQSASTKSCAECDACRAPTSLNFKAAIQNGKAEASEHSCSVSEKNLANDPTLTPSIPSGEAVVPPVECSKPASNVEGPSVITPPLHVVLKKTYASVVAKQAVVSTPAKASSPRGNVSPKVSTRSGGVSKALTSPSKVTPRSPKTGGQGTPRSPKTGGQGTTTSSAFTEGKGIYIGGLPYGITKQEIVDVVKQFGVVRRYTDDVQIRRHEDGFCCGFVEFESVDSARRAVETHHVMFGDKEAYITYKRQYNTRGTNSRPRSPKTALQQNGSARGRENAEWTSYSRVQAKGAARSSSSDQWLRKDS